MKNSLHINKRGFKTYKDFIFPRPHGNVKILRKMEFTILNPLYKNEEIHGNSWVTSLNVKKKNVRNSPYPVIINEFIERIIPHPFTDDRSN